MENERKVKARKLKERGGTERNRWEVKKNHKNI